jgi:adenine-specific DNA-methyltransferase
MSSNGVLLSSIDDYEVYNLIQLQRDLFGQSSFIANFIRKRRASSAMSSNLISQDHEYITCFARSEFSAARGVDKTYAGYSNPDDDPKGDWTLGDLTVGMNKDLRPNQFYDLKNPKTNKDYPANSNRVWAYIPESMQVLIGEGRVVFPDDPMVKNLGMNLSTPMMKRYKANLKSTVNPVSTWIETLSSMTNVDEEVEHMSAGLNTESTKELQNIFGANIFPYAKPTTLPYTLIKQFSFNDSFILDFFAGSGTTAHGVINLNREDGGKRKYIQVEVGEYFETILKPRTQKIIYSKDWRDGKPVSREGSSHLFKYIRLESYEDALNNLELKRTEEQASLLEAHDEFREDYMLRYMLDVEARGSTSLLNIEKFADPFNYQLNVSTGASVGETRPVTVDLVETFNYLLGLRIKNINTIDGFRVIEGTNPEGEKVLVIWRNTREKSNDHMDQFFQKQEYNTRDRKFGLIYTNGDNNLENLKRADETWKVRLIEEEFQRLMFDVQDV